MIQIILYSVRITESCDGLESLFSINKSRKHLLCKCNSSGNPSYCFLTRIYINKHKDSSKNCYCQYHYDINVLLATLWCIYLIKRLTNLYIHECTKVIQPTEIYNQLNSN